MTSKVISGAWLIWSHEHTGYWPRNQSGYVTLRDAGRFTLEEAVNILAEANQGMRNGLPEETILPDPRMLSIKEAF